LKHAIAFLAVYVVFFVTPSPALPATDPHAPISDAEWAQAAKANPQIAPKALDRWRRYTIRDVAPPAAPPAELGNRRLAELGYVDAAAAPFGADPTGTKDATDALQAAIDYATRHRMATYLPAGDYLVSNTLELVQPVALDADGKFHMTWSGNTIEGATDAPGRRARLVLAPRAPGFGDPAQPKLVVFVHNLKPPSDNTADEGDSDEPPAPQPGKPKKKDAKQGTGETQKPNEANSLTYNLIFRSIDIVIGPDNRGAVALRLQGAEGCTIQDVTIDATHGHVGLWGAPGSGGSTHGLTVLGGDIGVETRQWPDRKKIGCQPSPSFSGLTLRNQRQYAMAVQTRGACVAVGCRLARNTPGPLVMLHRHWQGQPYDSSLGLIDSTLEYESPNKDNIAIENVAGDEPAEGDGKPQGRPRSYYFNHVYLKNVAATDTVGRQPAGGSGGHAFRELAVSFSPQPWHERTFLERIYVDGQPWGRDRLVNEQAGAAPPADLQSRHALPAPLPSAAWANAVSIRRYAERAKDGDWAPAIQAAVNENEIVALPIGTYPVRTTIQLKPNTQLLGVHPIWSAIAGVDDRDRRFGGAQRGGHDARPVIATADDAQAKTFIGWLGLRASPAVAAHAPEPLACYPLLWRAGASSVVDMLDYSNQHGEGKQYFLQFTMRLFFGLAETASPATDPASGLQLASTSAKQPRLFAESPAAGHNKKKSQDGLAALTTPFDKDGCGILLSARGRPFDLDELQVCHATFEDAPDFSVTIAGQQADGTKLQGRVAFTGRQPLPRLEPRAVALGWKQVVEARLSAPKPFGLAALVAGGKKTTFDGVATKPISLQRNDLRRGFEHFPFAPNVHPMILITGHGGGRWYNFWRHGDIWAQEDYRQVLVKDNLTPLHIYHWHLQHVHSAAQAGFVNAGQVSVYGIKHEHQSCFLEVVRSDRIRIFGSGGLSNAAPGSAHFRFVDTANFLVSNLADEIHLNKQDRNIHTPRNPLVQNDPSHYAGVQDTVAGQTATDRQPDPKVIDRPILWRRGQP